MWIHYKLCERWDLADAEFGGEGKFALAEVEGKEGGGAEGEGGSDVKDVESAGAKESAVL